MEYAMLFTGEANVRMRSAAALASLRRQLVRQARELRFQIVGAEIGKVHFITATVPDETLLRSAGASADTLRLFREVGQEIRQFNSGKLRATQFRAADRLPKV